MRQKAVKTADELRIGLKPGGNETLIIPRPENLRSTFAGSLAIKDAGLIEGHTKPQ